MHFFWHAISQPLEGAAPWNFYTRYIEIDQNYLAHTPTGTGVIKLVQFLQYLPQKICDDKKSSKIFRDFWQ